LQVEASDRLVPQTQVLTGPDRLVVDFPNALPAAALRDQVINRGGVKTIRVGLFQSKPPVTRLVVDLQGPQPYEVVQSGHNVTIRMSGAPAGATAGEKFASDPPTRPGLVTARFAAAATRVRALEAAAPPKSTLEVTFRDGLLTIHANKASLSDVLFAVHQRTGAEVTIAAGAEQEQVAAEIGPLPAPEAIARLLNGSKFNYLILSNAENPRLLDKIILSPIGAGMAAALGPKIEEVPEDDSSPVDLVKAPDAPPPPPPPGPPNLAAAEPKPPAADDPPPQ
jgi:hypothetical protein